MSLNDDINLGALADEEGDDYTQEEINEESLYIHDMVEIYESINTRVSEYTIKFLLNNMNDNDLEFWKVLLIKLIKRYFLNPLKLYTSDSGLSNLHIYTRELLLNLKIDLQNWISEKKITESMSREEFEEFLKTKEKNILLKYAIKFIDAESYKNFMKVIFLENQQEFNDL